MQLFSGNARYIRRTAQNKPIKYKDLHEIRRFFVLERRLSGVHQVSLYHNDSEVRGRGIFNGQTHSQNGEIVSVELPFFDVWRYDEQGKISERWSAIVPNREQRTGIYY